MKHLFSIVLMLLFTNGLLAQSLSLTDFEKLVGLPTAKAGIALVKAKGFTLVDGQGSGGAKPIHFTKDIYTEGDVPSVKETVFLSIGIAASYVLKDPKEAASFIQQIQARYKKGKTNAKGETSYRLKGTEIIIEKTSEPVAGTGKSITAWYFTIMKF